MRNKKSIGLPNGPNEFLKDITQYISVEGYKRYSEDINNPYNIIESGNITMEDVDFPVKGTDNLGNEQIMMPGMNYQFPGDSVLEVPMAQHGIENKYSLPKRNSVRLNYDEEGIEAGNRFLPPAIRKMQPKEDPIYYDGIVGETTVTAPRAGKPSISDYIEYRKQAGEAIPESSAYHHSHRPEPTNSNFSFIGADKSGGIGALKAIAKGVKGLLGLKGSADDAFKYVQGVKDFKSAAPTPVVAGYKKGFGNPYENLPITDEMFKGPANYGVDYTGEIAKGRLDFMKSLGRELDDINFDANWIGPQHLRFHGSPAGRSVIEVALPGKTHQTQLFYKSSGLAGKSGQGVNGTTQGLWQPYGGHATMLHPQGPIDDWFIKDGGYENFYNSKSYRDVANRLDDLAKEAGFDLSNQAYKYQTGREVTPKAQTGTENSLSRDEIFNIPRTVRYEDSKMVLQDKPIWDGFLDEVTVTPYTQSELAFQERMANKATGAIEPVYPLFEIMTAGLKAPATAGAKAIEKSIKKTIKKAPSKLNPNYYNPNTLAKGDPSVYYRKAGKDAYEDFVNSEFLRTRAEVTDNPIMGLLDTKKEMDQVRKSIKEYEQFTYRHPSDFRAPYFSRGRTADMISGGDDYLFQTRPGLVGDDAFTSGQMNILHGYGKSPMSVGGYGIMDPMQRGASNFDVFKKSWWDGYKPIKAYGGSLYEAQDGGEALPTAQKGREQPTISQYEEPAWYEKAVDYLASPMTTLGYLATGQDLPDALPINMEGRNVYDMVIDMINPVAMAKYAAQAKRDYDNEEYLSAGLNTLGALPVVPATLAKGKKLLPPKAVGAIDDAIKSAYKYNPVAYNNIDSKLPEILQFNRENNSWLRQVGKPAIDDIKQTGVVRELNEVIDPKLFDEKLQALQNQQPGIGFSLDKRYNGPFFKKGETFFDYNKKSIPKYEGRTNTRGKSGSSDYLIETKSSITDDLFQPAYNQVMYPDALKSAKDIGDVGIMKPLSREADNFNFYKKDWWKGYKQTPLDKLQPGGSTSDSKAQVGQEIKTGRGTPGLLDKPYFDPENINLIYDEDEVYESVFDPRVRESRRANKLAKEEYERKVQKRNKDIKSIEEAKALYRNVWYDDFKDTTFKTNAERKEWQENNSRWKAATDTLGRYAAAPKGLNASVSNASGFQYTPYFNPEADLTDLYPEKPLLKLPYPDIKYNLPNLPEGVDETEFRKWVNYYYPDYAVENDISSTTPSEKENDFIKSAWYELGNQYEPFKKLEIKKLEQPALKDKPQLSDFTETKSKGTLVSTGIGDGRVNVIDLDTGGGFGTYDTPEQARIAMIEAYTDGYSLSNPEIANISAEDLGNLYDVADKQPAYRANNRPLTNYEKIQAMKRKMSEGGQYQTGGEHTVSEGETFYGIANKNGLSWKDLEAFNPNININALKKGQIINLSAQPTKTKKSTEEKREPTSWTDYINPYNWGVSDRDDDGSYNQAFRAARNAGEDEFMWYGKRYTTELDKTDVAKEKEPVKKEVSNYSFQEYQDDLRAQENLSLKGWDSKRQLWFPTPAPEKNGGFDIGYGHKIKKGENFSKGLTDDQVNNLFAKDLDVKFKAAKSTFNRQNLSRSWDELNEQEQILLGDYQYNGVLGDFKKLMKAVANKDKDSMLKEYVRYQGKEKLGRRNDWTKSYIDSEINYKKGGEPNPLTIYSNYINGDYDGTDLENKAIKIYDRLNRIHYKDAKSLGMSPANYILTHVIGKA